MENDFLASGQAMLVLGYLQYMGEPGIGDSEETSECIPLSLEPNATTKLRFTNAKSKFNGKVLHGYQGQGRRP